MLPLCDMVPTRTRPVATLVAVALVMLTAPGWPAGVLGGLALWLFGPAPEDRLGRLRYVAMMALAAGLTWLAANRLSPGHGPGLAFAVAAVAAAVAARLVLYPRGRILGVTPVVIGFEFVDLPSWLYAAVWLSAAPLVAGADVKALGAALLVGASTGVLGGLVGRRPERMRVEWWDPHP